MATAGEPASNDGVDLTIRDAARATGLSVKALRRRIERGTLEAVLVDGIRRIPLPALMGAGLLVRERAEATAPRVAAPPPQPAVSALLQRVAGLEARLASVERRLAEQQERS